jgi:pyridoxine kinase
VKPARLAALVAGLAARGAFARCGAVVSGYLGAEAAVPVVLDAVARARAANPAALYACDPVIGDAGRVYVPAALVGAFRDRLLPVADIAFPNPFELEILTGRGLPDRASAFAAMAALGPPLVVLTGFRGGDTAPGTLDVLLLSSGLRDCVSVMRLDRAFSGAGDAFAALFMADYLRSRSGISALHAACNASAALLAATLYAIAAQPGNDELAIISAQDQWVAAASGTTR